MKSASGATTFSATLNGRTSTASATDGGTAELFLNTSSFVAGANTLTLSRTDGGADFTLDALSLDVAPYQEEVITCTADAMDFQSHCLMEDWVRVYDVAEGVTMYVDGIISGPGGVVKRGSGTLVLAGSKGSCGDVYVNKGVLEFASDASWLNGTNVVVTGGTLRLTASEPFNRECVAMNISGGGKIELANGARQHVASLTFDGVPQAKKGSYGADKYPDYISGTGVLIIPGGGTLIIIK